MCDTNKALLTMMLLYLTGLVIGVSIGAMIWKRDG
jgi:hypothetical protein